MRRASNVALILVALAAGCDAPGMPIRNPIARVDLGGQVALPQELLGNYGGKLVSSNAASIVASNTAKYTVGAVLASPSVLLSVPAATASLVDASGKPVAGSPTAVTDADGRFTLRRLATHHGYFVAVQLPGGLGVVSAYARLEAAGTTVPVDLASTLVTSKLLAIAQASGSTADQVNPAAVSHVEQQVESQMAQAGAPNLQTLTGPAQTLDALEGHATGGTASEQELAQGATSNPTPAPDGGPSGSDAEPNPAVSPSPQGGGNGGDGGSRPSPGTSRVGG